MAAEHLNYVDMSREEQVRYGASLLAVAAAVAGRSIVRLPPSSHRGFWVKGSNSFKSTTMKLSKSGQHYRNIGVSASMRSAITKQSK